MVLLRLVVTIVIAAVMFALAGGIESPPVVRLQVRPMMCFEPCDWLVEARIQRHVDNRYLVLVWQDGMDGSSWITLDGEQGPFFVTRRMRSMEAGEYLIFATVLSATAIRGQAVTRALVKG